MTSPDDEWSDHVDIVRRALAVLAEETRSWSRSAAPAGDEPPPAPCSSALSEDGR
jgi:hypothetical protein